ncbi:MAG: DUF1080 domain-containing protein [Proteiniphilum sp.]|nr:DUF1080 domain-containing protein [Proteiniphilum sp.]MDD3909160.1 DUF1080 domain-containing protein [Proteiniphilum sp.]
MKLNYIIILIGVITITSVLISCNQKKEKETGSEWIQLFNGEDLSGWTPKITGYVVGENWGNTFRVEDGMIKVRYDQYDSLRNRFGHLFYKDEFSHYMLRVEYRILGEQAPGAPGWAYKNSGIMIHGQTPESMDIDQDFPTSIEVQLLGSDSIAQRANLNVCTPGTNIVMENKLILDHCINSTSGYFYGEEWITVEVEVRGSEVIRHIVNGDTVLEYNQPQLDERDATYARLFELNGGNKILSKGTISLQSEGHPIDFRKVEIMVMEE